MSDPENTELTQRPDHTPHAPHPPELRERAFELHCQFQSNAAIAATLGVPERTVRSWVSELLTETTGDLKKHRYDALCEAVASQRAIAAAAWNAFNLTMDHERARLAMPVGSSSPLLARRGVGGEDTPTPGDEDPDPDSTPLAPPSRAGKGFGGLGSEPTTIYRSARLLLVAFAAQREIASLLRLYEDDVVPREPIEILITRNPPWPEPDPSDWDDDDPDAPDPDDGGDEPPHRPNGPPDHPRTRPPNPIPSSATYPILPDGSRPYSYHPVEPPPARPPEGRATGSPLPVGEGVGVRSAAPAQIENPATPATPQAARPTSHVPRPTCRMRSHSPRTSPHATLAPLPSAGGRGGGMWQSGGLGSPYSRPSPPTVQ